jgi:hypothetical protein
MPEMAEKLAKLGKIKRNRNGYWRCHFMGENDGKPIVTLSIREAHLPAIIEGLRHAIGYRLYEYSRD